MTAPVAPVELQFWIAGQSPADLTVAYRVTNHLPVSIYLFNLLHRGLQPDGAFAVHPNLVYVELAQGGVHLMKWIPPIPEDISVEEAIIPLTTLLRSGAMFEEAISLPLPVASIDPYHPRRGPPSGLAPVTYGWIDFTIGYLPVSEMGSRSPHRARTTMGESIWVHALSSAQTVLRSTPVAAPVPVFPDRLPPPQTHICPACGATNIGWQRTCLRCSAPLLPAPAPPAPALSPQRASPAERHCIACNAVISANAHFCGHCGASQ